MSVSGEQPCTLPDITSFTRIFAAARCFGRRRHANIAVGNHAHHFPAIRVDDREDAEIAPPHLHRCIRQIGFRPAALHLICHYIFLHFYFFCLSRGSQHHPVDDMLRRSCEELRNSCSDGFCRFWLLKAFE